MTYMVTFTINKNPSFVSIFLPYIRIRHGYGMWGYSRHIMVDQPPGWTPRQRSGRRTEIGQLATKPWGKNTPSGWWFGCHQFGIFPEILGISSSLNWRSHIFQDGVAFKPPTSHLFSKSEAKGTSSHLRRNFARGMIQQVKSLVDPVFFFESDDHLKGLELHVRFNHDIGLNQIFFIIDLHIIIK